MASKAKSQVHHGALEELLDLPEGVWIESIERVPLPGGEFGFDLDLRSEDPAAFPAERIELMYERGDTGSIALTGILTPGELSAAS